MGLLLWAEMNLGRCIGHLAETETSPHQKVWARFKEVGKPLKAV